MKKETLKRSSAKAEIDDESDYAPLSEDDEVPKLEKPSDKKKRILSGAKHENKKLKSAKLTKQPTTEELNRLRETENLFNSNFFRLQIEEILKEVTPKSKCAALFKKWFAEFNNFLLALEDGPDYKISEQDWLSDFGIEMPIIQEPFDNKGSFKFVKGIPSTIIGSHGYCCNLGPKLTVDLKIEIPRDSLHKNDYLNERYLRKRALYLSYLAAKLNESDMAEDLKFKLLNGSSLRPVLSFKPSGKVGKHISILLHVVAEEGYFKLFRMNPSRNNIREDWRFCGPEIKEENFAAPTPFYNSALLQDLTCDVNNAFLVKIIGENDNIKQGILLLKIWLKQRHITTFSGYIMTMFVAHLVQLRRINNNMSSYQVIRNVWTALASSEWDKTGITLYSGEAELHQPAITEFHSYFPVVFVDRSGYHNICSHLGLDIYHTVRHESQLAVTFLDSQSMNGFLPLFMMSVDFHLKYDHIIRIENTESLRESVMKHADKETKLDVGADTYLVIQKYISELIRKGLGERVSFMAPKCLTEEELSWSLDTIVKADSQKNKPYIFGLIINPDYAFNTVDKGPEANLPQAEKFREFWGAKSELRRFADGSISEACVWTTAPTVASKRLIVKQILHYLLESKLGIKEKLFYVADQFEFILHSKKFQPANFDYGTGEEAAMKLSASFDELTKSVRALTDMPLEINSLYGISPVFSFCDPIPPLPYAPLSVKGFTHSEKYRLIRDEVKLNKTKNSERTELCSPLYIPALKVIIQLSQSGKWPDEIEALRRIKTAFNIQISEALQTQCSLTSHPWSDHVDVIKDGYVFRLEIAHRKEINLMKEVVDKEGVTKYRDTEESLEIEYKLMHLPQLRIALNGLHHQNKAYGPSVCLLKRWLRSHMMDTFHFPDICIDMLAAHVFVRPEPFQVPIQPQVAFWRALRILATHDWNTQMIILNFNDDLTREEMTQIESNFTSNRATLPAMYFLTPYEGRKPSVWSRAGPTFQVLARIQMLAAESLRFVDTIMFKKLSDDVKIVFKPNIEGYDVLIHLKADFNPLNYLDITKISKAGVKRNNPYEKSSDELFPVVDFDPVQIYLKQLRSSYDEYALFFHDTYGGDVIGVLWKPPALEFKEFKTSLVNGRKPVERSGKVGLIADLDSILDGYLILGEGLVKEIQNKSNLTI